MAWEYLDHQTQRPHRFLFTPQPWTADRGPQVGPAAPAAHGTGQEKRRLCNLPEAHNEIKNFAARFVHRLLIVALHRGTVRDSCGEKILDRCARSYYKAGSG